MATMCTSLTFLRGRFMASRRSGRMDRTLPWYRSRAGLEVKLGSRCNATSGKKWDVIHCILLQNSAGMLASPGAQVVVSWATSTWGQEPIRKGWSWWQETSGNVINSAGSFCRDCMLAQVHASSLMRPKLTWCGTRPRIGSLREWQVSLPRIGWTSPWL